MHVLARNIFLSVLAFFSADACIASAHAANASHTQPAAVTAVAKVTQLACVTTANELTNALAALDASTTDTNTNEIRIHTGTYFAPAGGWIGAFASNHDLIIRGGYVDAACTQQVMDASLTVLDGNHASGVLTLNPITFANSSVEVSGLTFQNGNGSPSAVQSGAGGLKIGDPGPIANGSVLVERNIFRHNAGIAGVGTNASAVGGLLVATDGEPLIVRGNLFFDNRAPNMGAAFVFSNNAIDVSNNTFVDNQSTDATVQKSVIMDFFTGDRLNLSNNIFWENVTGGGTFDIDLAGQIRGAVSVNNDIETPTGTGISSTGALHVDPSFFSEFNADFRLSPSSPLINAGVNNATGGLTDVDLDGTPRVDGTAVDLGAYESSYIFSDGFESVVP